MTAAAELDELVRKAIRESRIAALAEIGTTVLVWSRVSPIAWIEHHSCFSLGLSPKLPPFYIFVAVLGLLGIIAYFGTFLVTFPNQRYEIRPISSVMQLALVSIFSIIVLFATLYRWVGVVRPEFPEFPPYYVALTSRTTQGIWECIYFSVITITTVGYGDYHPTDFLVSRFAAGFEALLGYIILGLLVSALSAMFRQRRDVLKAAGSDQG